MGISERTFVLLKPDALELGLKCEIERKLAALNLALVEEKTILLDVDFILKWRDWPYYTESFWKHVAFIISSPVVAQIWEGAGAINKVREVKRAVREEFAESLIKNIFHSSDDATEAEIEMRIFFPQNGAC